MPRPPASWPAAALPRLMGLDMAAYYCGVSRNTMLRWIEGGRLPEGRKISGRVVWDRSQLDVALDRMMGVESRPLDARDEIDHDEEAKILAAFGG